jgi:hypothetical protein
MKQVKFIDKSVLFELIGKHLKVNSKDIYYIHDQGGRYKIVYVD